MDITVTSYRTCFGTDAGKRTLGNILIDGGYFDTDLKTEGEIAVQNFVKGMIEKLGIDGPKVVDSYVQKLFELPNKVKGTNGKEDSN